MRAPRSVPWSITEVPLQKVASLAVPTFADWCAVDIVEPAGRLRRLAVAHVDPEKVRLAQELDQRYPPDSNAHRGAYHVLRTGRSELVAELPAESLVEAARDEQHLSILRELGLRSYMCVPLRHARQDPGRVVVRLGGVRPEVLGPTNLRLLKSLPDGPPSRSRIPDSMRSWGRPTA